MCKSKIKILDAKYGDAFIIECCKGEEHGTIVVDGGPFSCGYRIVNQFLSLNSIDLMVLTHYDEDHIGGILNYINYYVNSIEPFPVKEMWVNNCKEINFNTNPKLSFDDAMKLSDSLEKLEKKNETPFIWKPYISEGHISQYPFATIEVVSPSKVFQNKMIERIEALPTKLSNDKKDKDNILNTPLPTLEKTEPRKPNIAIYNQLANATSIAFILRCDDFSILMLGDSYPQNVEAYLRKNGYNEDKKLKVDYIKVAHHGSKNNTSSSLLNIIECNNFIITTNASREDHPCRETIARIVCHKNRNMDIPINIFLNYSKNCYKPFINEGEEKYYNFKIIYDTKELP